VGCYIWYSEDGNGRAAAPPRPLLAVSTMTAHPSTASVPITVVLCDGPLLCGFNVAIKGFRGNPFTAQTVTDSTPPLKQFLILFEAAAVARTLGDLIK